MLSTLDFCRVIDHVISPKIRKRQEGLDIEPSALKIQKPSGKKIRNKSRDGDHASTRVLALEGLPRSEHIEGDSKIEKKKMKKKMRDLIEQNGPNLNNGDIIGSEDINTHESKPSKERY